MSVTQTATLPMKPCQAPRLIGILSQLLRHRSVLRSPGIAGFPGARRPG